MCAKVAQFGARNAGSERRSMPVLPQQDVRGECLGQAGEGRSGHRHSDECAVQEPAIANRYGEG